MIINKAILHILDFNSGVAVFSQEELDLSNDALSTFLHEHLGKIQADAAQKSGSFVGDNWFAGMVNQYRNDQLSLGEFSTEVGGRIYEQLSGAELPDPTDFMVVDYSESETQYICLLLLTNKIAYTHQVYNYDGVVHNEIIRHYAILPNTTQRIDSFAIINCEDMSIGFVDKKRVINGEEVFVLPEKILMCESKISSKEAVRLVKKITTKVCEDHGFDATRAISKTKTLLASNAEESSTFSPLEMGRRVFAESEIMKREFESEVREAQLPEDVKIEKAFAIRTGKNHKIKTDTGIEITFPADYYENQEFIEVINKPNGTISIELKNIGKIINK